ncbi:MAG: LptA/OstA family protein [Pseudomonadota bacterium]
MLKTTLGIGGLVLAMCFGAQVALAQEDSPFGGFKHDNTAPIDITSDALEVRQSENLAIFSGNVIAGQGTMRLTAERLDVYYKQRGDNEGTQPASDDGTGAIEKIDAFGSVFLCNGSETAQGNTGTYDVKSGTVSMRGDVVLTQGSNAILGPILQIDLNTGVGQVIGTDTERVRSRFTPSTAEGAEPQSAPCGGT